MAGLMSLPTDLVRLVLELAEPPIEAGGIQPSDIAHRALLGACCLVSRQWAAAAQPQLAWNILVKTDDDYNLVDRAIEDGTLDISSCKIISAERDVKMGPYDRSSVADSVARVPRLLSLVQRATRLGVLRLSDVELLADVEASWPVRRVWTSGVAVRSVPAAFAAIGRSRAIREVVFDKLVILPPDHALANLQLLQVGTRASPVWSVECTPGAIAASLRSLSIYGLARGGHSSRVFARNLARVRLPALAALVVAFLLGDRALSGLHAGPEVYLAGARAGLRDVTALLGAHNFAPVLRSVSVELDVASDRWASRDDGDGSVLSGLGAKITRAAWLGAAEWDELGGVCASRSVNLALVDVPIPWLESLFETYKVA